MSTSIILGPWRLLSVRDHQMSRRQTMKHSPNVVLMLALRLRRRANIKPTLGERLVFSD